MPSFPRGEEKIRVWNLPIYDNNQLTDSHWQFI